MFTGKRRTIDRWEGVVFILIYASYTIFLIKGGLVMEKNENGLSEYTTPSSYVFGWLCISFGSIPLLEGMNSKNKTAVYIGLGLEALGIILLLVGKIQSKALVKKLSKKRCS
jgi:Ca2+/Na+ antiporter